MTDRIRVSSYVKKRGCHPREGGDPGNGFPIKTFGNDGLLSILNILLLVGFMTAALAGLFYWGLGPGGFWTAALFASGTMFWIILNHGSWILKDLQAQTVQPKEAPEIYSILEALSQKAGIRTPQLYGIASASANILSVQLFPRSGIVLTLGGTEHLNLEELEGVLSRELVRLQSGDSFFTGLMVSALKGIRSPVKILRTFFCFGNLARYREPDNPLVLLLSYLLMPLEILLFAWIKGRNSQSKLDFEAASLSHPLYLASALRRLEAQTSKFPFRHLDRIYGPLFAVWPADSAEKGWKGIWDIQGSISNRISYLESRPSELQIPSRILA